MSVISIQVMTEIMISNELAERSSASAKQNRAKDGPLRDFQWKGL